MRCMGRIEGRAVGAAVGSRDGSAVGIRVGWQRSRFVCTTCRSNTSVAGTCHGSEEKTRAASAAPQPAEELAKICGRHSSEFEEVLGYSASVEACNRANIVITVGPGFAPLEPPPPPPDGAARAEI